MLRFQSPPLQTHRGWIRLEGKSVLITDSERLACRAR